MKSSMDKLKQIDKLLRVKELRRRLAEMEASKARNAMYQAEDAVERARQNEQFVLDDSDRRRHERMNNLMKGDSNIAVQNARVINMYAMTSEEILQSKTATSDRISDLQGAQERAKIEQAKLARFLQLEERTRKLCDRLIKIKQSEAARHG